MRKTRVFEWSQRSQDGREDVEDDELLGRPSTLTTDKKVKERVLRSPNHNQRCPSDIGILIVSCHHTFSGVLGRKRGAAKYILKKRSDLLIKI